MRRGVAAAAAIAVLVFAGCGDDRGGGPRVAWQEKPLLVPHPDLPGERLLIGRLRNDSDRDLLMDVETVRVLDARGRPVRATVRFNEGAAHALYPPGDAPDESPREERERLGSAATVAPGRSTPLVVAWRTRDGSPPVRIDFGDAELDLPGGS